MNLNKKISTQHSLSAKYRALGIIAEQIDYNKFCLYSPFIHSTAIEETEICKEIKAYTKSQIADLIKPISDLIKPISDPINKISDPISERLYQAIRKNNTLNYSEYGALLGVSEATIKRRLGELRKAGMIVRVGSNKAGHWEVISLENRKEEKV